MTHVRLDCPVQWVRLCGALVMSSLVFRIIREELGRVTQVSIAPFYYPVTGTDGQDVQLCLCDLWFSVDVCVLLLVLHTSEQVATAGTDLAYLAHRLGPSRRRGDADESIWHNVNPSRPRTH